MSKSKGAILLDVAAAAAIMVLVALTLGALFVSTLQIADTAQAVTRGRLLAQAHLELASAGQAPDVLSEASLTSTLTALHSNGISYWQVEVTGEALPKPLAMVRVQ
ncbi:MAG: hypothetical protein FH749_05530 [Firmicutes bacterium]|nr:hypothetical protein [Bacillota bacterium]